MREPDLMSSQWWCDRHGGAMPLRLPPATPRTLAHLASVSDVPVWLPHPPPHGWVVSGLGRVGPADRVCATVVALSGPSPVGGGADLLLVAEEPGIGLGAGYAGLGGSDPGPAPRGRSDAEVRIDGHPVRLWRVRDAAADRVALIGEASGLWLWLVFWPEDADVMLMEQLALVDARADTLPLLEFGAVTPRLADGAVVAS